jgi:ceramide glucosyltransferase
MACGFGLAATLSGTVTALRFVRRAAPPVTQRPPVSILKPLCGDEPLLEEALASFCNLSYPEFQLVLGVQDPRDPALAVVARIRQRFPHSDIVVVTDPVVHGPNRKVSNLINMLPAARHDVLVFADSDLHVAPDYLKQVVDALLQPGVGLVTTVSTGLPARPSFASALGSMQISHCFLPSVLLSRLVGRQDCLGTTMALHRRTLALAGGLSGLLQHLADDHVLGRRSRPPA